MATTGLVPYLEQVSRRARTRTSTGWISTLGVAASLFAAPGCREDPCGSHVGDICLLAGTGELGFNGDDKPATQSDLYLPSTVRRGPDGRIWVMDFNNQRLRRIEDDGRLVTVVGNGWHAYADPELPLLDTPLENPIDFRFNAEGQVVFTSYHDPRVFEVGADGTLETLAGAADGVTGMTGNEGDGGPALDALFIQLDGIVLDDEGSIYVSDSLANRVRRIRDGNIETIAGTGVPEFGGDGGPAVEAALWWPTALEFDAEGRLLIADTFNHRVRRIDAEGRIETIVGNGEPGFAGDDGPALEARLDQPYGLAVDPDGSLYIADRGNLRIRKVDPEGQISTLAGNGEEGRCPGGPALECELGFPGRIAMDGDELLIAGQSMASVWRLRLR